MACVGTRRQQMFPLVRPCPAAQCSKDRHACNEGETLNNICAASKVMQCRNCGGSCQLGSSSLPEQARITQLDELGNVQVELATKAIHPLRGRHRQDALSNSSQPARSKNHRRVQECSCLLLASRHLAVA